jgi:hypothetical protein
MAYTLIFLNSGNGFIGVRLQYIGDIKCLAGYQESKHLKKPVLNFPVKDLIEISGEIRLYTEKPT